MVYYTTDHPANSGEEKTYMAKVRCPALGCRSTDCTPLTEKNKYKAGKGIVGGAVGAVALGPVGLLAGAASGFSGKKKIKFMCNKCGKVFEMKI